MDYHITKDGSKVKIKELDLNHLKNIIRWIKRRAKEGVSVITGRSGPLAEDMWADEDTIYGEDAKLLLNYKAYIDELKRRNTDEDIH